MDKAWGKRFDKHMQETGELRTCVACKEDKPVEEFDKRRRFPTCKPCVREAKEHGKTLQVKASEASEVRNVRDLIGYAQWRLGAPTEDYRANAIILSNVGYSVEVLARVVDWCVTNGKHPREPWKIVFWADDYVEESKRAYVPQVDAVDHRLQSLYTRANPKLREQIRRVAGKPDKRAALNLLKEHGG